MTIYRPVPGYDDLYAGADGSIVSGKRGCALKFSPSGNGYLKVYIPGSGRSNHCQPLVHRLVAAAFLGPCLPGMEVRHGDGFRSNNRIENLCYGSVGDNAQDAMEHGTHQGAKMLAKTECPQGHPYSGSNVYVNPNNGRRHCRICQRAAGARFRARHGRKRQKESAAIMMGDN